MNADHAQLKRLEALQQRFAEACNALAPTAQRTRCWNRVALHHMAYKALREAFPDLGSQMVCNAIYAVSRACRLIYQHPTSPFHLNRVGERPLPLLQFAASAPVYFDRHTLSLRTGEASIYTLDGRMRFRLDLTAAQERRFREERLRELVLTREHGRFGLTLTFASPDESEAPTAPARGHAAKHELPEYLVVIEDPTRTPAPAGQPMTRVAAP